MHPTVLHRSFALLLTLALLTGCGDGGDDALPASAPPPSAPPSPAPEPDPADEGYSPNALASLVAFPEPNVTPCVPEGDQAEYQWYRTDKTLAVDPRNPDRLLISIERLGIFESRDGGATWAPASTTGIVFDMARPDGTVCPKESSAIHFDPEVPGRIYLFYGGTGQVVKGKWQARGAGMYISHDDGASWVLLTTPEMNSYTASLAIDPTDRDTIYVGVYAGPLTSTDADPTDSFVDVGMVYRIEGVDQGGTAWTELPTGWGQATAASALYGDPERPGRLVMGVFAYKAREAPVGTGLGAGWFESVDAGATWQSLGSGVGHGVPVTRDVAISHDGLHIINRTQSDAGDPTFVSRDGGVTWTELEEFIVAPTFDPHGAGARVYAILDRRLADGPNPFAVSEDGGLTWRTIGTLPADFATNLNNEPPIKRRAMPSNIVVHPTDPDVIWVSGAGGMIARSDDGGATWTMLMTWEDFPPFGVEAR